ncbi:hypothetical protein GCM10022223_70660 [Kineosporia mesophila]|uniref:HEAT repeat domain-containing protein n=1 Tax=Kineosporia mesophila TaxID=566012 RepID=A0ABP7AW64_9ACTN|nr:hypothetical protein [Kineosporia mesophila]MCD5354100.1 hypothetical protein [Kineosporia mesophila]
MSPGTEILRALELGTSTRPQASVELREFIAATGPGRQELRCASVVALACLAGTGATGDLAALLTDRTRAVRECAADLLYHVGDGRAWDSVMEYFAGEVIERGPRRAQLPPAMPISYLLIHAPVGSRKAVELVGFLRQEWIRLSALERQWLADHAPEAMPSSLDAARVALPSRTQLALTV